MANSVLEQYLSLPYHSVIEPVPAEEGGGWYGCVLELMGCSTVADTAEALARELETVKRLWLQKAIERGQDIPRPLPDEYSGRLTLRLPEWLHERLSLAAATQKVSLNSYLVSELTRTLLRGFPAQTISFTNILIEVTKLGREWPSEDRSLYSDDWAQWAGALGTRKPIGIEG